MKVIPEDLSGGSYPKDVIQLLNQLENNFNEEEELDDYYDDSVRAGCDCGCGGDSMMDNWSDIMEERNSILEYLRQKGYVVEGCEEDLN